MIDTTKNASYSLFGKDVFIYLLKGSIAGYILAASTYGAHLITEYGNETKAHAELSKARVKVEYYKELKALAEESKSDGNSDLLKEFNQKYKLAYRLALNDFEVATTASEKPGKVLEVIGSITRLIASISYVCMLVSCLFLIWNSRELNKNHQEFTIKDGEIELLKNSLGREIKTVKNNNKISNVTIEPHEKLLKKLPGNLQIDGVNKAKKITTDMFWLTILVLVFGLATFVLVQLLKEN